jgi:hypothetical protein
MSVRSFFPVATVAVSLALAMSLVGSPSIASAATTEDQVQDVVDEMFCFQPYEVSACYNGAAQTVTAGTDGDLIAVSLVVDREAFTTHDLAVQIRSGDPFGAVLATSDPVAASDIPTSPDGDWVMFVFSAPASLQAGDVYAIVLPDMPMSQTSDPRWALGKASDDVYPGGVAFGGVLGTDWQEYEDGSDFAFATYMVSGTPECDLALSASGGQPVDELTATVGDEVDVIGTDFGAFAAVTLTLTPPDDDPIQDGADADVFGDFGGTLALEAADVGEWQISAASDQDPDCTDTVALTVAAAAVSPPSAPSPGPTVPPTSTDLKPAVGAPNALLAIIATVIAGACGCALAARQVARRRS